MSRLHPAIARLNDQRTRSERVADAAVAAMGSVRFIVIQTVIVAIWITLNIVGLALQWDPYPFILLNLAFSTQAAYAAPLILLAGRRADAKRDALANDHYAQENSLTDLLSANTALTEQVKELTLAIHDHVTKG